MSILRNLPFEWLVGLRYTRSGRRSGRNNFISFISLLSMAGIALGVTALIVILSVMNGFQKEVRDRMLSVLAHIEVTDAMGSLPDWRLTAKEALINKEVTGTAPFVLGQAMVVRGETLRGVAVRGILPEEEPKVSDVSRHMKAGSFDSLQAGRFNILIGSEMARTMHIQLGSRIAVLVPQGQITPAGVVPRMKQFTVTGIFEAGHIQFDSSMTFIHIQDAEKMFQLNAPSGLRLRLVDMHRAPMVAQDLAQSLSGSLYIRDWSRTNRVWFAAVQTEKRMMAIILMLIIAVAAFNLVSTLVMTVTEKQADIAILRTLGASPRSIMKIFMVQGAVSGILGTAIGIALGVLISVNVDVIVPFIERLFSVQFLPKEIYLINTMPSELRWSDVTLIGGFSIVMAFFATIYPSWNASRVKPAEALRYE